MSQVVRGFTTRQVCELVGVPSSTLNSWASGDDPLVEASLLGSEGKRNDRYWSVRDVVMVRTIKVLRQAGCPMQQLRRASALVRDVWGGDLSGLGLYWDGGDLVSVDEWGTIESLVRHPGQQMLFIVAIPLLEWRDAAEPLAAEIDLEAIRTRRDKRMGHTCGSQVGG